MKFASHKGHANVFKEGIEGWEESQTDEAIYFVENPSWDYVEENETIASTTRDNIR